MTAPLAPGSVSLGLSLTAGPADAALGRLVETAVAAVEAGFDGVTLSEHHGGFAGYLPAPLLVSALIQERLPQGWALPCPMILPMRSPVLVAEELAWLAAAHPGRVAAGIVPGYQERDFALVEADFGTRRERYWTALVQVVDLLRGAGIGEDPALAACRADPLPIVSGVAGRRGARRAAAAGAGLMITSLPGADEVAGIVAAHREAGGDGPYVLIRRAWVGGTVAAEGKLGRWRADSGGAGWLAKPPAALATGSPEEVASRLAADVRTGGATSLNVRIDVDGADHAATLDQIATLGRDVLPAVRATLSPTTVGGGA